MEIVVNRNLDFKLITCGILLFILYLMMEGGRQFLLLLSYGQKASGNIVVGK